jgi:hypothetical protein
MGMGHRDQPGRDRATGDMMEDETRWAFDDWKMINDIKFGILLAVIILLCVMVELAVGLIAIAGLLRRP